LTRWVLTTEARPLGGVGCSIFCVSDDVAKDGANEGDDEVAKEGDIDGMEVGLFSNFISFTIDGCCVG